MKKVTIILSTFVLLITICPLDAEAVLTEVELGTKQFTGNVSFAGGFPSELPVRFYYSDYYPIDTRSLSWDFAAEDVGFTFFETAQTNEDFDGIASLLTNGQNEQIEIYAGSIYHTLWESEYPKSLGVNGPDFNGYTITKIGVTANDLVFEYYHLEYDITVSIWGIPEPATLLLLGLGAIMLKKNTKHAG